MKLSSKLKKQIIDFLLSLPSMVDTESQRAFLSYAGIDPELENQVPFGKPPMQFFPILVSTLVKYGKLNDGQYALECVLETSKSYIGPDRRKDCENLIRALQRSLQQQNGPSTRPHRKDKTPMNENIDFTKKIDDIERLLNKEEYTASATRCVIIIDLALRQMVSQHLEKVDAETKRKVQEAVQKRDRRGGGFQDLTMGGAVNVLRESKFLDSYAQKTGKDLSSLQIIDLDKLTALRNKFAHQDQQASPDEARLLLQCLKVILTTFGIDYKGMLSPEPPIIVEEPDKGTHLTAIQQLINLTPSSADCQIIVKSWDRSKMINRNMTFRDMILDEDESDIFRLGSRINLCYSYSGLAKLLTDRDMDFQEEDLSNASGETGVEITIFDFGTTGRLTVLMPDHLLEEGRIYQFPDAHKNQSITLTGMTGTETVIAIATLKEVDFRARLHLNKGKKAQTFTSFEAEQIVQQINRTLPTFPENSWALGRYAFEITN